MVHDLVGLAAPDGHAKSLAGQLYGDFLESYWFVDMAVVRLGPTTIHEVPRAVSW